MTFNRLSEGGVPLFVEFDLHTAEASTNYSKVCLTENKENGKYSLELIWRLKLI